MKKNSSVYWSITILSQACLIHCNALWPDWSDVAACSTFLKKVSRLAKVHTAWMVNYYDWYFHFKSLVSAVTDMQHFIVRFIDSSCSRFAREYWDTKDYFPWHSWALLSKRNRHGHKNRILCEWKCRKILELSSQLDSKLAANWICIFFSNQEFSGKNLDVFGKIAIQHVLK